MPRGREDKRVKRLLSALAIVLLVTGALLVYRTTDACVNWRERYKRFLYSELIKLSPFIYTPEMIEEIIGERPLGCDAPTFRELSDADIERFQREGVGPNEFLEERRAASRRSTQH
jgi:hypothetical protein